MMTERIDDSVNSKLCSVHSYDAAFRAGFVFSSVIGAESGWQPVS